MTTAAQMKTALGLTSSQLTKVTAYLDRVSPKMDDSDPPEARANTVDDFKITSLAITLVWCRRT